MKILFTVLFFLMGATAFASSALNFSVIPNKPVLIPFGSTTVGGQSVTAPYFIVNNLKVAWNGPGALEVIAVVFASHDSPIEVTCAIAGDNLTTLFPNHILNGNVILGEKTASISNQTACSGFALPTPYPRTLNIPVTGTLVGVILDAAGNAVDVVKAETELVVQ